MKDAVAQDAIITLADDVTLDSLLTIAKNVDINLNGHNITRTDGTALYVTGGDVTITGNGTITAKSGAVYVYCGNVTINGGTYVGLDNPSENGTIVAKGVSSEVTINAATVNTEEIAIRTFADAKVTINGGEFTSKLHTIFACERSEVTINGGTFSAAAGYVTKYDNSVDDCDNCDIAGVIIDNTQA